MCNFKYTFVHNKTSLWNQHSSMVPWSVDPRVQTMGAAAHTQIHTRFPLGVIASELCVWTVCAALQGASFCAAHCLLSLEPGFRGGRQTEQVVARETDADVCSLPLFFCSFISQGQSWRECLLWLIMVEEMVGQDSGSTYELLLSLTTVPMVVERRHGCGCGVCMEWTV